MNEFVKSHGLGNSYIIVEDQNIDFELNVHNISKICSVRQGIGADGILVKVNSQKADFGLRIFNSDGSEAEKSGNGVRIFSKYLFDHKFTGAEKFTIDTLGGIVDIQILETKRNKASLLKAGMGNATFKASKIPVSLNENEIIEHELRIGDQKFIINCVSIGNPHCVIFGDKLNPDYVKRWGPVLENHPLFPERINVQFAKIVSKNSVDILIWERGSGYTSASGTSSCAVVAVGMKRGLLNHSVNVLMPGGKMLVDIEKDWSLKLTGPVEQVCTGIITI